MIKDRRTQKEEIKPLRPLLDKQVIPIHLAKAPFEPTPAFSLGNPQITGSQKMVLLLMEKQWDYLM